MAQHEGLLCPACKVDLVMTERQNVEIDYCPKCRGVWLDRGELDKILEKSVREAQPQSAPQPTSQPHQPVPGPAPSHGYERRKYDDDDDRRYHGGGHHKGYRRKSWLEDIFD